MTLFTAEGLIRAVVRGQSKGICHAPSVVHHALMRWFATQGETGRIAGIDQTGLINDPRLSRRRAPGNTCLSALGQSRNFGDMATNDSKGCGTIMRVAPIGLFRPDQIDSLADECSHLTHGHQTGRDAARAFAHVLSLVLGGMPLTEALRQVQGLRFDDATLRAIRAACAAPADGKPQTVETLGGGWVAEQALSIALYAARAATGFEHGLRIAVTHSGDSDSTGAIAGNLLGLMFPDQVMAHPWRGQIECADLIDRLAGDLHGAKHPDPRFAELMWDLYPGF